MNILTTILAIIARVLFSIVKFAAWFAIRVMILVVSYAVWELIKFIVKKLIVGLFVFAIGAAISSIF